MKCTNCGFISSKTFYRCPYCGHIHQNSNNIFDKSVTINNNYSIRIKTIIYIVLFNLLGACLLADMYLSFDYAITLWGYLLLLGAFTVVQIISSKRGIFSGIVRVNFYLLFGLLLAWCYFSKPLLHNIIVYIPTIVIPAFIILFSLMSAILLFTYKGEKRIRPIWFEVVLFTNLTVMTVLFIFFLICKYNLPSAWIDADGVLRPAADSFVPFDFMAFGSTPDNYTSMFIVEEILIFAGFGLSLLYVINYNVTLIYHIYHQVKGFYGKPRD